MTYTLPADSNINFTQGGDRIFVYLSQQIPSFIPMMLVSLFLIVFLGGYVRQRARQQRGDLAMWFTIAGFLTTIISIVLTMVEGLISLDIVVVNIAVLFVGVIWFFFSGDR